MCLRVLAHLFGHAPSVLPFVWFITLLLFALGEPVRRFTHLWKRSSPGFHRNELRVLALCFSLSWGTSRVEVRRYLIFGAVFLPAVYAFAVNFLFRVFLSGFHPHCALWADTRRFIIAAGPSF